MKIRTRLSILCSTVFGIIFIIIAFVIYALDYDNTRDTLYNKLQNIARVSALFYLEEDELNSGEFEKVSKQFNEIVSGACCQVYGNNNDIRYGEISEPVPVDILDHIRERKQASFVYEKYFCHGIFYEDNQGNFVIVAKEEKNLLENDMKMLAGTLFFCLFTGLIAIAGLSRLVAGIAYRPFGKIINQVHNITASDLEVRIESPETQDELQELTDKFNELLNRISESVVIQRNFVSYVSHEFKTPLTSLLGNLEVFGIKNRTPEEYKQLSEKLILQVKQLEEILDTLILISDLRKEVRIEKSTRPDLLVSEIIELISEQYPYSKIRVNLKIEERYERLLNVPVERTQMLLMLFNLLENAVKYSQGKPVDIIFSIRNERLFIEIVDRGIGIMPEHLAEVSKPFYRADHTNRIKGSGIGLSIALRIMKKNNIKYEINSTVNVGTTISMEFIHKELTH
jgi:signal transduction histidine kinase